MNSQNINKPKNKKEMITHTALMPNIFSLIKKAVFYKNGALLLFSAPFAEVLKTIFELLTYDIDERTLLLPVIIYGMLFITYTIITITDFYTGIQASKKEHLIKMGVKRGYMKSSKLWSSIWKMTGVVVISNTILMFSYIFLMLGLTWLHSAFLVALCFFFLMVMLFDLHSIGENQERRFNKKPKIYNFLDRVSTAIENGIINRIK